MVYESARDDPSGPAACWISALTARLERQPYAAPKALQVDPANEFDDGFCGGSPWGRHSLASTLTYPQRSGGQEATKAPLAAHPWQRAPYLFGFGFGSFELKKAVASTYAI